MSEYLAWARGHIEDFRLASASEPRMAYEDLLKGLIAVCTGRGQLFGLGLGKLDADDLPAIRAEIVAALCEYKTHHAAKEEFSWVLELDGYAKQFAIDALRFTDRPPLRCDPLGARDALAPAWQARLARLDAVCAGSVRLALESLGPLDGENPVRIGARDDEALYREALLYERGDGATFPRELAAWWTTANGIFVDEHPLLEPVRRWQGTEIGDVEGLRIGAGSYSQGSLFLVGDTLDGARVVETDDEEITNEFDSFADFVDMLLGEHAR